MKSKKMMVKQEPKDQQTQPSVQEIEDKVLQSASGGGTFCATCACTN